MLYVYLRSQVRQSKEMVRVCSVWPTLSIWCIKFQNDLHFLPYLAYSKTLFISELIELNVVCLSSFTGASNPRNDGASVFLVAYSKHLVHKISD